MKIDQYKVVLDAIYNCGKCSDDVLYMGNFNGSGAISFDRFRNNPNGQYEVLVFKNGSYLSKYPIIDGNRGSCGWEYEPFKKQPNMNPETIELSKKEIRVQDLKGKVDKLMCMLCISPDIRAYREEPITIVELKGYGVILEIENYSLINENLIDYVSNKARQVIEIILTASNNINNN